MPTFCKIFPQQSLNAAAIGCSEGHIRRGGRVFGALDYPLRYCAFDCIFAFCVSCMVSG